MQPARQDDAAAERQRLLVPASQLLGSSNMRPPYKTVWQRSLVLIPIFYLVLGFSVSFPFVAQRQYLRNNLELTPSNQGAVLGVIIQLPWFVKLVFAFLSDSYPCSGARHFFPLVVHVHTTYI